VTREAVRIIQVPRFLSQFDRTCTYVSCTIGSFILNSLCLAISMCMHLGKVLLNVMFYPNMKVNNWKTSVLNILYSTVCFAIDLEKDLMLYIWFLASIILNHQDVAKFSG
jgi:hypothetical protein